MSTSASLFKRALVRFNSDIGKAAVVAIGYFVGAEIAFFIGTLSDKIFAPLWPPNTVLFCALVLAHPKRWWIYILAAFPAHIVVELGVGMGALQLLIAFITNVLMVIVSAAAMRRFVGDRPWFRDVRKTWLYVLITALVVPAIVALGGAFVPILGGGSLEDFGLHWTQWFASNSLGSLALTPIALILLAEPPLPSAPALRTVEALVIGTALVVVCTIAFEVSAGTFESGFLPALLYSPLPLILWSTVRFGASGASGAVLIVSAVLIWRALNGPSLFIASDPETNVFALQVFLIGLAIPVLLLGAAIEETRRAERTTRDSEEQMSFAATSANIGLWQHNLATGDYWATEHCRDMFGLRANAPLSWETVGSSIHPDDRDMLKDIMRTAVRSSVPAECEFRVMLPGEQARWMTARAHATYDDEGSPVQLSGLVADITARKTAEHQIELQRRELAHLTRVSVVGELSGAIAHELNQPLTAILANAQASQRMLVKDAPDLPEIGTALDDIVQAGSRASEVISRVRKLLKKGESRYEAVDINELFRSTLNLLHSELIARRITVQLDLAEGLPLVVGDPVELQQVLLNLAMNASDAMSSISTRRRLLTLTTRTIKDGFVEGIVSDQGRGITPDQQGRLFEPFYTTKEHGLGLGLSICSTIINSHGGDLRIVNNETGGARAVFVLPAHRVMVAAK
jgi:signal transduction histidine kinase/integral membrane sensor domain MASE1